MPSTSLSIISLEIHRGQHVTHAMHSFHIPPRRAQFLGFFFFFFFYKWFMWDENKINLDMNMNLRGYYDPENPVPSRSHSNRCFIAPCPVTYLELKPPHSHLSRTHPDLWQIGFVPRYRGSPVAGTLTTLCSTGWDGTFPKATGGSRLFPWLTLLQSVHSWSACSMSRIYCIRNLCLHQVLLEQINTKIK